jgi:DNA-binding SARP family transcriptional activator/tetratricopeptide (TPR) repeat protein
MALIDPAPVSSAIALRLLGPAALSVGGRETAFTAERPYQLLAYLAVKGGWVPRDELAELLYPDRGIEAARSNLRKVLLLARRIAGAEGATGIEQQGELLRWTPDSDVQRFERACKAGRLAEAVALYAGPLLQGLDRGWSAVGADWLMTERIRLEARWHEVALRQLRALSTDEGDPAAAEALAQALLRHDPLDDEAMQALVLAQSRQARPTEALGQLAGYSERLAGELGLAPSAALEQLGAALRSGEPVQALARPAQADDAGLIGRRHELAQIRERLARPDCRLLAILGPGGMGKTALARSVTDADAPGAAGIWVALDGVDTLDDVPSRIAAALGLKLRAQADSWAALAQALNPHLAHADTGGCLLVLDNLEHLPLAAPLNRLLADVPALRILATSRVALGLACEWRLPLGGLPLPDEDERDVEVLRANDAVRLFERHALPLAPDFRLAQEAAEVVRLVHAVEGMPLALRLLAGWRRLMPVRDILAELEASVELLEPSTPQERSVRAAFERSWQQLGAIEQRVLAQMALLPAPLDRALLRAVLAAPLPVLAALTDRSLVRADGEGRFSLHPLILRFAAPLAEDEEQVRERHARHVARTLIHARTLDDDHTGHLRAAWDWAVAHADVQLLGAVLGPLVRQLVGHARWPEALQRLQTAMACAERSADADGAAAWVALRPRLRVALAEAYFGMGQLDRAQAQAHALLAHGGAPIDPEAEAAGSSVMARVHWMRGDYEGMRDAVRRQVAVLQTAGRAPTELSNAICLLGLAEKCLGNYEAALSHYRQAFDAMRADPHAHVDTSHHVRLGNLLRSMGRYEEGLAVLEEGRVAARAARRLTDEPYLLTNIALVHECQGRLDAALTQADLAVDSAVRYGEPHIKAASLLCLARVAAAIAAAHGTDALGAEADIRAAFAVWRELGSEPLAVQCVASAGLVLAQKPGADPAVGLALVRWAMAHPAFVRSEQEDAQTRLSRLNLPPEAAARADAQLAADAPLAQALLCMPESWRP